MTPQPFTYDDSVIEIVIAQAMTVEQLLGRTKVLTKAEGIAHGTVAVTSAPSFFFVMYGVLTLFSLLPTMPCTPTHLLPVQRCLKSSQEGDDDLVVSSTQSVKLMDPLAYTRIDLPGRGVACNHIQCFDLQMFLKVGLQRPSLKDRLPVHQGSPLIPLPLHHRR